MIMACMHGFIVYLHLSTVVDLQLWLEQMVWNRVGSLLVGFNIINLELHRTVGYHQILI